jgi:SAM-dependent methyltransferase
MKPDYIMDSNAHSDSDLQRIYAQRFSASLEYRRSVWRILVADFFQKLVPASAAVLDLGCGYGEFINQVAASAKFGMDLNPDSRKFLAPGVELLAQDCSAQWPLPDSSLDVVFTSNFSNTYPTRPPSAGRSMKSGAASAGTAAG